jgi:hypothetical protein
LNAQPLNCKQHFGYLSERSKGLEIPDDCVACPKSLECMLYKDKTTDATTVRHGQRHASLESLLVETPALKPKASPVRGNRTKVHQRSVIDLFAKELRICCKAVFQTYCWMAVKIVYVFFLIESSLTVANSLIMSELRSRFSEFFKCFWPFGMALWRLERSITRSLETVVKSLFQGRFGMSMSLTRRVKPSVGVLHIEALGVAVNMAWTPRST